MGKMPPNVKEYVPWVGFGRVLNMDFVGYSYALPTTKSRPTPQPPAKMMVGRLFSFLGFDLVSVAVLVSGRAKKANKVLTP